MAILGSILKRTIQIGGNFPKIRKADAYRQQTKTLKKLLTKAEFTAFGEHHRFSTLLNADDVITAFQTEVATNDYNSIFKNWWYRALNGEPYVCWPDHVKYFALSSGTSEASSKQIPITKDMLKAIKKTSLLQIVSQCHYNLPKEHFERGMLMIGGSTHLNYNGTYFEGDLSGITASSLPFWFQHFYKPGTRISKERDWNAKLDDIVKNAPSWDISVVCGVPAWIQILFEKIIQFYKVTTIHDIWPNLAIYVHGGVHFEPYKKGFEKLLAHPIIYLETYLASEGFIAYQNRPDATGMKLVLNNGLFYEFVPFTEKNFSTDGVLLPHAETLHIGQVQEGVEYALLISTCAGAWRYLIGDTIKFTSLEHYEVAITGRTKHFLSLCGEHLSQDNMNKAIKLVSDELDIEIKEFSVCGINHNTLFAHRWYIGTDEAVDVAILKEKIDHHLKILNDDYRVERSAALKDIFVEVIPTHIFYDWLRFLGKEGGQNKFPRVMKKDKLVSWEAYLKDHNPKHREV